MSMSWSTSQSTPNAAFVAGDISANCCSPTLFLLSSVGVIFKTASLFDGMLVFDGNYELNINLMFLIRSMVCTSLLTDFNKLPTTKFRCKVSETYNP